MDCSHLYHGVSLLQWSSRTSTQAVSIQEMDDKLIGPTPGEVKMEGPIGDYLDLIMGRESIQT